jgi:hypothetical protein
MRALSPAAVCDKLAGRCVTALLLLAGFPEPAVSSSSLSARTCGLLTWASRAPIWLLIASSALAESVISKSLVARRSRATRCGRSVSATSANAAYLPPVAAVQAWQDPAQQALDEIGDLL